MSRQLNMAEKRKNGYVKLELHIGLTESLRKKNTNKNEMKCPHLDWGLGHFRYERVNREGNVVGPRGQCWDMVRVVPTLESFRKKCQWQPMEG